jgi:cysteine desulfuration protein SufE|tara:strand:- start:158 stop:565 length:408 start_codon:yes stop_codon:yes gene_type:complete
VIKRKLERYLQILSNIDSDEDKFIWIMDFGKNSVTIPEQHKVKSFEVPGCQSQTWLIPHFVEDDKIYFTADSAALISKGMVCIIADVYSGSRAQDIREFDQKEFEKMNLSALLTPGRNNGVHSMLKKIKFYSKTT